MCFEGWQCVCLQYYSKVPSEFPTKCFLLCSEVEFFFLREMEHTFVYACFRTCRAILNMNCVGLRKTSATENLIAVILTLVTGLVI